MSNYRDKAINPKTGKVEVAEWMDNYFGHYRYGVRFDDGSIYPAEKVRVPKNEDQAT